VRSCAVVYYAGSLWFSNAAGRNTVLNGLSRGDQGDERPSTLWLRGYFASRTAQSGNGFRDERCFEHVVAFCERAESELAAAWRLEKRKFRVSVTTGKRRTCCQR